MKDVEHCNINKMKDSFHKNWGLYEFINSDGLQAAENKRYDQLAKYSNLQLSRFLAYGGYSCTQAIDFDGTIANTKWPEIISPNQPVVDFIKQLQNRGDLWILWTNRDGQHLDNAVAWCKEQGITPDAINDNLQHMKDFFGNNPRKIFANFYIDDHNAGGLVLPDDTDVAPVAGQEGENGKMTEFERKVKEMRSLQKQYFATRSPEILAECKQVEKEVDNMLYKLEPKPSIQLDIFGFDGDDK